MATSVVSFSFSWCSTGGQGAQLSAECWLPLPQLVTNGSPKLLGATSYQQLLWTPTHQGLQGPLRPGVAFPLLSLTPTVWLLVLTELYNSSTPTQSPTQSLEWHVWSSSSGNNCHAVQRSLSSGASVYECIMVFFTLSYFVSQFPPTRFLSIIGHWDVSLLSGASLWNGIFGRGEGQNTPYIYIYIYAKHLYMNIYII